MTIAEFLTARLTELIEDYDQVLRNNVWPELGVVRRLEMAKHLAQSQLKIVEWHKQWPVLVKTPPNYDEMDITDVNSHVYQLTQQILWCTQEEFVMRFGEEPPTAPHLLEMAQLFSNHRDFNPAWRAT